MKYEPQRHRDTEKTDTSVFNVPFSLAFFSVSLCLCGSYFFRYTPPELKRNS